VMLVEPLVLDTIKSFIALVIILDPFLGAAVFVTLTKGMKTGERAKEALTASLVALTLLLGFLFTGSYALDFLGISFASFKVAGGIILLILGIQAVLGIEFSKKHNQKAAAVIIGTPLLCGPGAMTTIVVLAEQYGYTAPVIASVAAIVLTWFLLFFSRKISEILGERLIEVFSRVMGLLLAALAAEFIKDGIVAMISGG